MVAVAQRVAVADALDAGPVRRPGRRPPLLHADAQDAARTAARPSLSRLPRRLQRQNLQRCRHPLQRTRYTRLTLKSREFDNSLAKRR